MGESMKRLGKEIEWQTNGDMTADPAYTRLIHEDDDCWIFLYEDMTKVVEVVYKDPARRMQGMEIE